MRFTSPVTHKERCQGLGTWPQVSLAEARAARDKALSLVRSGIDPIDERTRRRAGTGAARPSFDDCARLYIAAHAPSWRNAKHRSQWANTLRDYASPVAPCRSRRSDGARARGPEADLDHEARNSLPRAPAHRARTRLGSRARLPPRR